jgi:hypothetical protein
MLEIDPFKLYIGAGIDTGGWLPDKKGERILLGVDTETQRLKVGFFYPSFKDSTAVESHMLPMAGCKLILRSIDEDMTGDERDEIKKMGFTMGFPRHYVHDADGDTPRWTVEQMALLSLYLVSKHFSVGTIPKTKYFINNSPR